MSYDQYESSAANGDPILFFEFTNIKFGTIYYTNASLPITVGLITYQPCPIKFSNVKSTKDVQTSELTLTFPMDHELPGELRRPFSQARTMILIRRAHRKDLANSLVYWRGRIINITTKPDVAEILCENMQTIMKRLGNTQKFQKLCRHGLYSMMCGLDYNAWQTGGTVTEIVNSYTYKVTSALLHPSGYYKGGIINSGGDLGFIVTHIGDTVTLLIPMDSIEIGDTVTLAPGCGLSISVCNDKFNNKGRHGGFPATPSKSPHDGINIFSAS